MSIPRTLPQPSTRIGLCVMLRCKSAITPFPSGMMYVAQAHVSTNNTGLWDVYAFIKTGIL
jgi:hypothetical protein